MNTSTTWREVTRAAWLALQRYHAPMRIQQPTLLVQRHVRYGALSKSFAHRSIIASQVRHNSSATGERPLTTREAASENTATEDKDDIAARKAEEPAYEMTFTCKKCEERSTHRITKQAYHHGTTLITCPSCKGRHLISDHLKIFSDKGITVEDILKEKGELLKKGRLGQNGDIEFYAESDQANNQDQMPREKM